MSTLPQNNNADAVQVGWSPQTEPGFAQRRSISALDGAAAGIVPAVVGAEAMTTGTEPIAPAPSDQSKQALDSNASATQFLVPDTAISGEYIDDGVEPKTPNQQKQVEPLARAALSSRATTMDSLHRMSENELSILETLTNEGKQRLKDRLMRIWNEMARRFELGENLTINGTTISGTGGKGMGKYLRLIGIDPAKRRFWKFEIKQKDMLLLAREIAPSKPKNNKKGIVVEGETEAHHIAKRGLRIAQTLAEESMVSPQERVNRAQSMSKELLEAVACGNYEVSEPLPPSGCLAMPEQVTYSDWENHRIPAAQYKLKYFEEASLYFCERYHHAFQSSPFKKVLDMLKGEPGKVSSNGDDLAQLAVVLRGAGNNLNLLAAAITTALIAPSGQAPKRESSSEINQLSQPLSDAVESAEGMDGEIEAEPEIEQLEVSEHPGMSDSESEQSESVSRSAGASEQKAAPLSKMVYEASPGGPKIMEVPIPGKYRDEPPKLKYYVCHGDQLKPYLTLSEAKAACSKIAEPQQPTKDDSSNARRNRADQSSEPKFAAIAASPAAAHQQEPTLYYKKRVLRGDGEEFVDYPVFQRGGDDVPEDVFDAEADAKAYVAKATENREQTQ